MIVHLSRMRDGARRVTHVTEVVGMEGDMVTLQDIFLFKQQGIGADGKVVGQTISTGLRPRCAERIEQEGISLPPGIFAIAQGGDRQWR